MATGNLVTPKIAKIIDGNLTKHEIKPIQFDKYINEIRKGMYDVCNTPGGTGYRVMHDLPIVVAGKTGTSQITTIPQSVKGGIKEELLSYFHKSHAWFTSYAPYDDPKFVVTILIEHGGHGGSASAPLAAKIYKWLYAKGYFNNKSDDISVNIVVASENNTSGTIEGAHIIVDDKTVKKNNAIRKKLHPTLDLF
jgi:penicillin-binding protein 2